MTTACTDGRLGQLLTRYELGLLPSDTARDFEVHLLACDACFERLESDSELIIRLLAVLEEERGPG